MGRGKSSKNKKLDREAYVVLTTLLVQSPASLKLLSESGQPAQRAKLEAVLTKSVQGKPALSALAGRKSKELFDGMLDHWASPKFLPFPPELRAAMEGYRKSVADHKHLRRFLLERLGLLPGATSSLVDSLPTFKVHPLSDEEGVYPPYQCHISESSKITNLWHKKLCKDPLPDPRHGRRPIHALDPNRIALVVKPEESCKIVDATTGELIAIVLRGISGEEDDPREGLSFLEWAVKAVDDGLTGRRNIRVSAVLHLSLYL